MRNKRSYSNRNHGRFEEGGSRNRNSRWEQPRGKFEEREVALPEINEEREVPWASLEWKHMKKERSV